MPYETEENGYGESEEYDGDLPYLDDQQETMRTPDNTEDSDSTADRSNSEGETPRSSDASTVDSSAEAKTVEDSRNDDIPESDTEKHAMEKIIPSNGISKSPENLRDSVEKMEVLLKTSCTQSDIMQKRLPKDLKEILKKCPKYFREAQDESFDETAHLRERYNMLLHEMQKKYDNDIKALIQPDSPNGNKYNLDEYLLDMQLTYNNLLKNSVQNESNASEDTGNDCPENTKNSRKKFINGIRKVKKMNRSSKTASKVSSPDNEMSPTILEESADISAIKNGNEEVNGKYETPVVNSEDSLEPSQKTDEFSETNSVKGKKVSFADSDMLKIYPNEDKGNINSTINGNSNYTKRRKNGKVNGKVKQTTIKGLSSRNEALHKTKQKGSEYPSAGGDLRANNFPSDNTVLEESDQNLIEQQKSRFTRAEEQKNKSTCEEGTGDDVAEKEVITSDISENPSVSDKGGTPDVLENDRKLPSVHSDENLNLTIGGNELNTNVDKNSNLSREITSSNETDVCSDERLRNREPSFSEQDLTSNKTSGLACDALKEPESDFSVSKETVTRDGKVSPVSNPQKQRGLTPTNSNETEKNVHADSEIGNSTKGPDSSDPGEVHILDEVGDAVNMTSEETKEMGGMLRETPKEIIPVVHTDDSVLSTETDAREEKSSPAPRPDSETNKSPLPDFETTKDIEPNESEGLSVVANNSPGNREFPESEYEIFQNSSRTFETQAVKTIINGCSKAFSKICESEQVVVIECNTTDETNISVEVMTEKESRCVLESESSLSTHADDGTSNELESQITIQAETLEISEKHESEIFCSVKSQGDGKTSPFPEISHEAIIPETLQDAENLNSENAENKKIQESSPSDASGLEISSADGIRKSDMAQETFSIDSDVVVQHTEFTSSHQVLELNVCSEKEIFTLPNDLERPSTTSPTRYETAEKLVDNPNEEVEKPSRDHKTHTKPQRTSAKKSRTSSGKSLNTLPGSDSLDGKYDVDGTIENTTDRDATEYTAQTKPEDNSIELESQINMSTTTAILFEEEHETDETTKNTDVPDNGAECTEQNISEDKDTDMKSERSEKSTSKDLNSSDENYKNEETPENTIKDGDDNKEYDAGNKFEDKVGETESEINAEKEVIISSNLEKSDIALHPSNGKDDPNEAVNVGIEDNTKAEKGGEESTYYYQNAHTESEKYLAGETVISAENAENIIPDENCNVNDTTETITGKVQCSAQDMSPNEELESAINSEEETHKYSNCSEKVLKETHDSGDTVGNAVDDGRDEKEIIVSQAHTGEDQAESSAENTADDGNTGSEVLMEGQKSEQQCTGQEASDSETTSTQMNDFIETSVEPLENTARDPETITENDDLGVSSSDEGENVIEMSKEVTSFLENSGTLQASGTQNLLYTEHDIPLHEEAAVLLPDAERTKSSDSQKSCHSSKETKRGTSGRKTESALSEVEMKDNESEKKVDMDHSSKKNETGTPEMEMKGEEPRKKTKRSHSGKKTKSTVSEVETKHNKSQLKIKRSSSGKKSEGVVSEMEPTDEELQMKIKRGDSAKKIKSNISEIDQKYDEPQEKAKRNDSGKTTERSVVEIEMKGNESGKKSKRNVSGKKTPSFPSEVETKDDKSQNKIKRGFSGKKIESTSSNMEKKDEKLQMKIQREDSAKKIKGSTSERKTKGDESQDQIKRNNSGKKITSEMERKRNEPQKKTKRSTSGKKIESTAFEVEMKDNKSRKKIKRDHSGKKTNIAPPDMKTKDEDSQIAPPDAETKGKDSQIAPPDMETNDEESQISTPDMETKNKESQSSPPDMGTKDKDSQIALPNTEPKEGESHIAPPDMETNGEESQIAPPDMETNDEESQIAPSDMETKEGESQIAPPDIETNDEESQMKVNIKENLSNKTDSSTLEIETKNHEPEMKTERGDSVKKTERNISELEMTGSESEKKIKRDHSGKKTESRISETETKGDEPQEKIRRDGSGINAPSDLETNDEESQIALPDMETNDEESQIALPDMETNDEESQSPPPDMETNDESQISTLDIETKNEESQSALPDMETKDEKSQSPPPDMETNDESQISTLDMETKNEESQSALPDMETKDEKSQSPPPDMETNDESQISTLDMETNDESQIPTLDMETKNEESQSPPPDMETKDEESQSPPPDMETKNEKSQSPPPDMDKDSQIALPDTEPKEGESHIAPPDMETNDEESQIAPPDMEKNNEESQIAPPDMETNDEESQIAPSDMEIKEGELQIAPPDIETNEEESQMKVNNKGNLSNKTDSSTLEIDTKSDEPEMKNERGDYGKETERGDSGKETERGDSGKETEKSISEMKMTGSESKKKIKRYHSGKKTESRISETETKGDEPQKKIRRNGSGRKVKGSASKVEIIGGEPETKLKMSSSGKKIESNVPEVQIKDEESQEKIERNYSGKNIESIPSEMETKFDELEMEIRRGDSGKETEGSISEIERKGDEPQEENKRDDSRKETETSVSEMEIKGESENKFQGDDSGKKTGSSASEMKTKEGKSESEINTEDSVEETGISPSEMETEDESQREIKREDSAKKTQILAKEMETEDGSQSEIKREGSAKKTERPTLEVEAEDESQSEVKREASGNKIQVPFSEMEAEDESQREIKREGSAKKTQILATEMETEDGSQSEIKREGSAKNTQRPAFEVEAEDESQSEVKRGGSGNKIQVPSSEMEAEDESQREIKREGSAKKTQILATEMETEDGSQSEIKREGSAKKTQSPALEEEAEDESQSEVKREELLKETKSFALEIKTEEHEAKSESKNEDSGEKTESPAPEMETKEYESHSEIKRGDSGKKTASEIETENDASQTTASEFCENTLDEPESEVKDNVSQNESVNIISETEDSDQEPDEQLVTGRFSPAVDKAQHKTQEYERKCYQKPTDEVDQSKRASQNNRSRGVDIHTKLSTKTIVSLNRPKILPSGSMPLKHICPHRKRGSPRVGPDGQRHTKLCSEYQSNFAELSRGNGTPGKKWKSSQEYVTHVHRSYAQNGSTENDAGGNQSSAKIVSPKGNGRGPLLSVGNTSWSSRQVPKTMSIRRPDNLKSEGHADFTTIHQQDFSQRKTETAGQNALEAATSVAAGSTTESWNSRRVAKTQPIKRPDNLKPAGPFHFDTSYGYEYTSKRIERQGETQGAMENVATKRSSHRPKTSLKPSGEFHSESSYQEAYTAKTAERQVVSTVPKREAPFAQMETDADVLTSTNASEDAQAGASTTEDAGDLTDQVSRKSKSVRPPTTLKSEGAFASSTLNREDYKPIKVEKTKPIKPKSTYKLEGKFEGESTLATDFKRWEAKRPVVEKPKDQLTAEGDIDFTTTSKAEYYPIEVDKTKPVRPPTSSMFSGEFQDKTTTSDYKEWHVTRPTRIKPEDNLKPDGDIDFNVRSSTLEYSEATRQSIENYYKRVKKPRDHDLLGSSEGHFESKTSYGDFKKWEVSRPVVRKPANNIKQEGDLSFATTQSSDYIIREHDAEVPGQLETVEEHGEYLDYSDQQEHEAISESRQQRENAVDKVIEEKLGETRTSEVTDGKEDTQTTPIPVAGEETAASTEREDSHEYDERVSLRNLSDSAEDQYGYYDTGIRDDDAAEDQYVTWDQVRPKPIRPKSNLRQEGGMEFSTTNQQEFTPVAATRVKGIRPKTSTQITGDFESTTTNQVMYQHVDGERVSPIRPKNNLHLENGTFNSETTSGREFQSWKVDKPTAIRQKENIKTEGAMEFTTTHHAEFEEKHAERSKLTRPRTNTKIPQGEFEKTTTNQVMHPGYQQDKVQSIKPVTNLKPSSGKFIDETTNKREFQNWTPDRQAPIIPTESMRQEGEMDFTTMNQIQFEEKRAEKVSHLRPHTSSKITGEFDGTTTNQVMFKSLPAEKANKIVPSPNLKLETGEFQSETVAKREFQQWPYVKPSPFIPKDNITSEGDVEYTTVSSEQYSHKQTDRVKGIRPKTSTQIDGDFDGTTTNQIMFQHSPGERAHEIRPSSNLHLEGGEFFDETTANREFQDWGYSKPTAIKPKGNITQEGDFDFTTTNQTQFEGKETERVSEIRPKTSSKITGEFDGTTTNQVMYQGVPAERVHGARPHTNIQLNRGDFPNETTANREFQNWGYSKPASMRPKNNLYQEGNVDYLTTNQIEFENRVGQKASSMRPKTQARLEGEFDSETMNHMMFKNIPGERPREIRPKNNIELEHAGFQSETTAHREFQRWDVSKQSAIFPKGNLTQEGEMDFTTSNQREYQKKVGQKAQQIRPHTSTKITGDFEGTTTNQVMFQAPHMEKVHDIRPQDNLHLEGGTFEGETTSNREYLYRAGEKPAPIKPKSTLEQEGSMDFTTFNQIQFGKKAINRVEKIRPPTTAKMSGEFYATTTNQSMFQAPKMEKVQEIRPHSNIHVEEGKIENITSMGEQFQKWPIDRPAAIKPVGNLRQEGDMRFETTTMSEYIKKDQEKAHQLRPKTSTKIEGEFDPTTTNQTMFTGLPSDRVHPIRQEDNLHIEKGKFYDETTTSKEYRQWVKNSSKGIPPIKGARPDGAGRNRHRQARKQTEKDAHRPKPTPESEMETATGRTVPKTKKFTPEDNLRSGGEHFMGGITEYKEYKPWKLQTGDGQTAGMVDPSKKELSSQVDSRAKTKGKSAAEVGARKGAATMEEFEQRQSDGSPRRSDIESVMQILTEQRNVSAKDESLIKISDSRKSKGQQLVSTVMADYGAKPVARVKAIIPEENLKQEGSMDFSTTSRVDYTGKQVTGNIKVRAADRIQAKVQEEKSITEKSKQDSGKETESQSYTPWKLSKSEEKTETSKTKKLATDVPTKPVVHMRGKHQEQDDDKSEAKETVSVKQESDEQTDSKKVRKRFKPDDNLKPANVPFDADSTTRAEYRKIEGRRSSSKRRSQTLKPEGEMLFSTTTSEDYTKTAKMVESERVKISKPKPQNNLRPAGEMDFATTTSSSYVGNSTPKTKALRPKSTLRFGDRSSPEAASQISSRKQSPSSVRQTDITSTTQAAYTGHEVTERPKVNRPPTVQRVGSGPFQETTTTTTKSSYGTPPKGAERTHLYRPESHHILDGGKNFYGNTTYRCSFEAMKIPQCPVVEIEAGKSNYTFKEEVNGHRFYLPLVEG